MKARTAWLIYQSNLVSARCLQLRVRRTGARAQSSYWPASMTDVAAMTDAFTYAVSVRLDISLFVRARAGPYEITCSVGFQLFVRARAGPYENSCSAGILSFASLCHSPITLVALQSST